MKDYLSSAEREKFLMATKLMDCVDEMVTWYDRDAITKDERKWLKTASTMTYKAFESIINRLNPENKRTIANSIDQSGVYLTNKFGLSQYMKKKSADEKACYELNKDYYNLVEEVMYQNCNGCKTKCMECNYYKLFEENYIADMGHNWGSCRFAYNTPEKMPKPEKN